MEYFMEERKQEFSLFTNMDKIYTDNTLLLHRKCTIVIR